MLVELGGGTNPHPRADVIIDLHHPKNSCAQDAAQLFWNRKSDSYRTAEFIRIEDGSVDEVFSSHFMEHIPSGQPRINVFNEAWRVLKPGGTMTMVMPLVGYTDPFTGMQQNDVGWQPWADPTHVSFWWLPESVMYFCEGPFKPHADYGFKTWGPLGPYVEEGEACEILEASRQSDTGAQVPSFWSVRGGWEGVCRLVKP